MWSGRQKPIVRTDGLHDECLMNRVREESRRFSLKPVDHEVDSEWRLAAGDQTSDFSERFQTWPCGLPSCWERRL